jgi:hypothetical protein
LTNLVDRTGAATFQLPAISDDDPQNGAESLAAEFNERNHFRIHYLNQDEVKELKKLGITTVFNLNAYDAYDGADLKDGYRTDANEYAIANTIALNARGPFMEEFAMNASAADPEIAVAMVGFGAADANTDVTFTVGTNQAAGELPERGWASPDFLGRIVLGFGPENSLVTGGLVANAAHCPGGLQNSDNITYNDYNLVLPRLDATVTRLAGAGFTPLTSAGGDISVTAVSYGEDDGFTGGYDINSNDDKYKVRTFDLTKQDAWQYATMCPEGHQFPEEDNEFWGIDLNAGGTIE